LIPQTQSAWILFALAVIWFALFFRLGTLPLLQPDEGRNAEVAREMKESGAWLSPSYNGITYLDKPAFYFKAVALSLAAFGDNETAARLPSAVFGLALLAITFVFCRRVHGTRCAVMAVIVIATMPLYVVFSRTIIFDMTLAFFVSAAIFAGYCAEECEGKSRRNWYLLGALAAGFATLVKGPVGFLIPGLVLFVFHRIEGRRGVWKRFFAPLNLLVFFGVTLPWFIGLSLQHPDFPYYGLIEESFHRFTTTTFHRTQPFYFYALIVAGLFLPWSFILPEAGVAAWKNKKLITSADRLCVVWAVVVVVFFSLSKSKLPGYILTATVACGILTARFFERAMANPDGKVAKIICRAAITLTVLCFVVAIAAVILSTRMDSLAKPLGLSIADAEELGRHFITPIILLSVFAVLGLLVHFRRDTGLCFAVFAIFPLLLFTLNFGAIEVVFNVKSARQLAQQIPSVPPETKLAFFRCFPSGLPFYLNRTATLITKDGSELTSSSNYILFRLKNDPAWPANLVPVTNFDQWISQRTQPVYLLAHTNARVQLETVAGIQKTNIQQLTPLYIGILLPAP
jgi:4-amino-4-deoxy-L-arabinose transferase-like glycosyltransferase